MYFINGLTKNENFNVIVHKKIASLIYEILSIYIIIWKSKFDYGFPNKYMGEDTQGFYNSRSINLKFWKKSILIEIMSVVW